MEIIDLIHSDLKPVPAPWDSDPLKGVMIEASLIQKRVSELAHQIEKSLPKNEPIAVISLLAGAFVFTSDLVRHWTFPFELDFMGVSSYGQGIQSGDLTWTHPLKIALKNKHLLIVDDILDTGQTLRQVTQKLAFAQPASIQTCVLLQKERGNTSGDVIQPDFSGFRIPDQFVVGYGLDFALQFRQFPFIGVLNTGRQLTGNDSN